jgi:YidC/Oxa1 family membrane protein insertase
MANVLQPLIDVADAVLVFFHDDIGLSWGMAIIALTVVTRIAILPLTFRQLKGMRALQALQPQLKEIQEKFKNDRQRMQQEMMKFYRDNKVNPLSACLPLLLQLPVFLTLFYALQKDLRMDICGEAATAAGQTPGDEPCGEIPGASGESFLFISDLTDQATGGELGLLLVLYVGTQLLAGLVMAISADRSQRILMFALPFIFVPFIITFPAGLVLYWITTNVWTIGQQYAIKQLVPPPPQPTPEEVRAAKPPPPPPRRKKKRRR